MSAETEMNVITLFSAEAILAGGAATSSAIALDDYLVVGNMSLQVAVTGTGTAKFEYLVSHALGGTYVTPSTATDLATTVTGNDVISVPAIIAPFIKIKVTEDGGAQAIAVTATLCIQ